ncbi:hypothetical protein AJ80_09320 [Polytolypa hystricis UAMH7299]|uniref:C2 domain-containing protein n=1 Tax=Polytolypa hystricis (strain UAMH7299) TaxID=1447883 RepID=A0A2B7WS72_POLH7|nr:hypothetical protein AJ80_09320 [Polytolypa hystricis UAMH7299]
MATQHKPGGYWSATNPIPSIQKFLENIDEDKQERDRQIDEEVRKGEAEDARWKLQREEEGTDATAHTAPLVPRRKGRKVRDPTTGREVEIDDVGKQFMRAVKDPQISVPNANLGKDTPIKTDSAQTWEEYVHNQDITAPPDPIAQGTTSDVPIRGEKTNILFHPTPSVSYEPMFKAIEERAIQLVIGILVAIVLIGKMAGGSLKGLIPLALCITSGVWLWAQDLIRKGRTSEWHSERRRGEAATANLLPESVEWVNSLLAVVWGLLNPDMFASVADTLEDVMQASVPSIIENVRVAEIDQGSNPFRILSMRALPDHQATDLKESLREHNRKTKSPEEAAVEEEGGDHYNLEVSFAYHAKPTGKSSESGSSNMHMLLVFYLGVKGLFGVPLPVFTELTELIGTVRLRLQLTPEPPFAKTLTFSLMGLPHVRAGCVPMVKHGVNILNLPLISNFVNSAIGATASLYVAPKSMCIDLRMLLQGDDIQKDTMAMGIVWIRIHRAIGLSKQDKRGSEGGGSDPYINLSWSKYGKPMYCTRVITDDLNPVWEESAALLVTPELIKADEQLSAELWDSDRNTADDIVGKIELSIQNMIQHPGKMFHLVSKLQGLHAGSEMPGELHWEVGYFGKPHFRSALRTDGKDPNLPEQLKDNAALQDEKGNINTDEEYAVTHTPPDPLWPSGICSIVVHQIVNLELANIKGSDGNRKGKDYLPAKSYGENTEEQGKRLPTSYCTILLNDQLVYRTRAKAVSSKPIFNAGTERFVRDWGSAIVTVTVRDQRYREHDPILGVIPLKLSDILQTSSQATRWYPLDGGIGFGHIRISLMFRSVETRLLPSLLGWDVGSFRIVSDRITALGYRHHSKLKAWTSGSSATLPRSTCHPIESGSFFDMSSEQVKTEFRVAVLHRHRSAVVLELHGRNTPGYAIVWLHDLIDNTNTDMDIPIWSTKNVKRLTQNYITEENWEIKRSPGLEDLRKIGRLQFTCQFVPGLEECHKQTIRDNDSRETYETWEACVAEGVRGRYITRELPETVRRLHERSLIEERDVLRQADPEEQRRWVSAEGTNWAGAFGENPHDLADENAHHMTDTGSQERSQPSISLPRTGDASVDGQEGDLTDDDGHRRTSSNISSYEGQENDYHSNHSLNGTSTHQIHDYDHDEAESLITTDTARRSSETHEERQRRLGDRGSKRAEHRMQRGVMQWGPARNAAFVKDEATFAIRKVKRRFTGGLTGREPDVETETG